MKHVTYKPTIFCLILLLSALIHATEPVDSSHVFEDSLKLIKQGKKEFHIVNKKLKQEIEDNINYNQSKKTINYNKAFSDSAEITKSFPHIRWTTEEDKIEPYVKANTKTDRRGTHTQRYYYMHNNIASYEGGDMLHIVRDYQTGEIVEIKLDVGWTYPPANNLVDPYYALEIANQKTHDHFDREPELAYARCDRDEDKLHRIRDKKSTLVYVIPYKNKSYLINAHTGEFEEEVIYELGAPIEGETRNEYIFRDPYDLGGHRHYLTKNKSFTTTKLVPDPENPGQLKKVTNYEVLFKFIGLPIILLTILYFIFRMSKK